MARPGLSEEDRAKLMKRCRDALMDCEVPHEEWRRRFPSGVRCDVLRELSTDERLRASRHKGFGDFRFLDKSGDGWRNKRDFTLKGGSNG